MTKKDLKIGMKLRALITLDPYITKGNIYIIDNIRTRDLTIVSNNGRKEYYGFELLDARKDPGIYGRWFELIKPIQRNLPEWF